MTLTEIFWIAGSYCLGSVPFGLLLARAVGVDVRKSGSGNIGATNVTRLTGKKLGFITLVLDIGKGFFPMYLAGRVLGPESVPAIALSGLATVLGHMYPVSLGFRGGKGVATGLGVFLALAPLAVLPSLVVFVLAVRFSGFVSLGSLLASAAFPLWLYLLKRPGWSICLALAIVLLIWWKHRANIGRLLNGTEKSWKKP